MPRKPTDRVVEHRITFGKKERQQMDSLIAAYGFNKIANPLVALVSDVSAMTVLVTTYAVWKYGDDALVYFREEAYDDVIGLFADMEQVVKGLPVIRQGISIVDEIQGVYASIVDVSPAQPSGAYWSDPNYDPSMWGGGRTR